MTITVTHLKTDTIPDWTQAELDAQITLGNFPPGTLLADIVLPSDWNDDHSFTGTLDQAQNNVAVDNVTIIGDGTPGNPLTAVTGGGGDVTGPASATDNAIARFDGTTGKIIQNSAATIADTSGNIAAGTYNGNTIGAGATSGTNTGDQTSIVGITGTKAQFDTAVTDGNFLYVGDVTQYTDEMAQDAVGAMTTDGTLEYIDATPLYRRAAITGDVTIAAGSNTSAIGAGVIVDADINASAAIDATKIADGTVTSTEFQFINTLSSNAQTQINGKQPLDATLTALAAYNTNGLLTQTAADTFTGRTATGTANRISVTNGDGVAGNPTFDISATYVGQASITTLGTITTGVWTGTDVAVADGGTGASTAAAARTNLGVAAAGITFGSVSPANDTLYIPYFPYACTIDSIQNIQTSSGTITVAVNINGTPVTGLSSLGVTSSSQDFSASAANSVALGDAVTIVLSSNSAAANLRGTILLTR